MLGSVLRRHVGKALGWSGILQRGATVERLYREVRSLRVCQGTSEILKLVIAGQILKESR